MVALAVGLVAVHVAVAVAAPASRRVGSLPSVPAGTRAVGELAGSTRISVSVVLKPRDPAALQAFANAVSTPGSSAFHQYLTVAEFAERFGAPRAQERAVEASLKAHGLAPGVVSANGLSIPVSATAAQLAHAFSTSFERYSVSGRPAYANTAPPRLDTSVAGDVQAVIGLDTLAVARPLGLVSAPRDRVHATALPQTGGPQPCTAASDVGDYTANQLAAAYSFSSLYAAGDLGGGQTVALFELEPNSTSDISAYQTCYGTSAPVTYTKVDGGAGSGSGSGEAALDIEDLIGLAPKASIDVYQGPNSDTGVYDTYQAIITADTAKVISTSWGECEVDAGASNAGAENTLFQEAATQGQSVFAAAGDSGSEDCGNDALAVDDPGSQPYVTSVGGASLSALGPPPTQSVWNDQCSDGPCGGGGGISSLWGMPSYQSGAPAGLNVINSNSSGTPCGAASGSYCREVPDVSADADPATGYTIYYDGSWGGIGGTSAAAPLWAAFMALVNASSSCTAAVGFANPALYKAAASSYSADFSDITTGNNDITGTNNGLFPAGPGFDMASGLGTPIGSALAASLCGGVSSGNKITVTNPGTQTSTVGDAVSLQIAASDSAGGQTLTYSATGLPAGLTINATSGLISGTPTTAKSSSVSVTATDTTGAFGTAAFTWTVNGTSGDQVTVTNPGAQVSTVGTAVSLQIHASDSRSHPTLTYAATGLPSGLTIDVTTGLISGTPKTATSSSVTVTATDSTGAFGTAAFTWTVNGTSGDQVTVTNPGAQASTVGTAVSLQIHASDSSGAHTALTYAATNLPAGLSIDPRGVISGTPTTARSEDVTVTATDSTGAFGTAVFTWTVTSAGGGGNSVTVTNPGSQTSKVGKAASLQVAASDSAAGQTLEYAAAGLPAGLSISPTTGLISGAPTTAGSSSVTVTVTDSTGASGNASFMWTVTLADTVAVRSPGPQTSKVGSAVSLQIAASDSASGQTLTYSATGLPAGLTISPTSGLISGTPTADGISSVLVTATDTTGAAGTAAFDWTVTGGSGSGKKPKPPTMKAASLTGVARGKPTLAFTVLAGTGSPALKVIQIVLPTGLGFSGHAKNLTRDIEIDGQGSKRLRFTVSRSHGLRITLSSAAVEAEITISAAALTESPSLEHSVARHRVKSLLIRLKVIGASGITTVLMMKLKAWA